MNVRELDDVSRGVVGVEPGPSASAETAVVASAWLRPVVDDAGRKPELSFADRYGIEILKRRRVAGCVVRSCAFHKNAEQGLAG